VEGEVVLAAHDVRVPTAAGSALAGPSARLSDVLLEGPCDALPMTFSSIVVL
jgi:hypothetical protein